MEFLDILDGKGDFDGTLFDTYPAMVYAFKKALEDSGINQEEENLGAKGAQIKACLYNTNKVILNEMPEFNDNSEGNSAIFYRWR